MEAKHTPGPWVIYNHLTDTYDTPDGTKVPAMLVSSAQRLVDVMHIAQMREAQRAAIAKAQSQEGGE